MNTANQIVATLRNWNTTQPERRKSLMDSYRGIKPITSIELRLKAKEAMDRLLDLEVYALFLTLATKDALK